MSYDVNDVMNYQNLQTNTTVPFKCEIVQVLKNSSSVTEVMWNNTQSYRCSKWEYDQTYFELTYAMQVGNELRSYF